jgi:predicted nucleotidyltransferase component of viral defense system
MSITSVLPNKGELEAAAIELAVDQAMIEKDWHVTQVLCFFAQTQFQGFQILFSGGTSLSKAHGLIKRFSEDIDFKVLSLEEKPSRKALSKLKRNLIDTLSAQGFKVIHESIRAWKDNHAFTFNLEYSSRFEPHTGLRPHIQLEFTVSTPELAPVIRPVSSLLHEVKGVLPEINQIECVNPVEIAADKLSALVWRIPRIDTGENTEDRSLVRHLHDLAAMKTIVAKSNQFPRLINKALQHDNERNKDISTLSNSQKFNLLLGTLSRNDIKYRSEYNTFVKGLSYASEGNVPDYDTAITIVKELTVVAIGT